MKYGVLFLLSFVFLAGCATSPKSQFTQVQVGMDKDQVLDIMESPQRTQRWHGMDRWTYIFYSEDQRTEKEVQFAEGKSNYVGNVFQPPVSADEQDVLNENSNREVEALLQALKEDSAKQYSDYDDGGGRGSSTIRFVPQFEPVQ